MVAHFQPHSCLLLPLCKAGLIFPTPRCVGATLTVLLAGPGLEEGSGRGRGWQQV